MKMLKSFLFLATLSLFLISCSEAPYYENVQSFNNSEWKISQKPTFEVTIDDTTKLFDFTLTIRTTENYKYSNLWIFWTSKTPDGKVVREPFELKITNPDGSWIGKNSGTVVENQLRFGRRKLPMKGKYKFTIEQGITQPKIGEILDIGLKLEEAKAE